MRLPWNQWLVGASEMVGRAVDGRAVGRAVVGIPVGIPVGTVVGPVVGLGAVVGPVLGPVVGPVVPIGPDQNFGPEIACHFAAEGAQKK